MEDAIKQVGDDPTRNPEILERIFRRRAQARS
ncbi:hypothetical protein SY94_3448 [Agrobacterium tumefaciens]|nr:hypothetical protein SY94_3448 [Agrobacterium tumefaciens]